MENKPTLNSSNPEAMVYETEEIRFTILGSIKLEGLDRLRVTLKIEVTDRKFKHYLNNPDLADLAIRHNIDLYNDTQVEKLVRKTSERLEVGSTAIAKAVADLTNQLENYRLQQVETKNKKQDTRKILSEQERKEAIAFLQQPGLISRTRENISRAGVIGEADNALRMLLVFTTRKMETPLHIVSFGSSGTGKTYLQEKISELIPEEDKTEITSLSENAFYYFGQQELKNKLILIEDLDGAQNVLYPLRELKSKKKITKTVTIKDSKGQTKTISLTVEGPVCVAGCTTQDNLYEDNANRSFLIYLDESGRQDESIMDRQRSLSAGRIAVEDENKIKDLMKNAQRVLQPVSVRNPYAEQLKIPSEVFKPRRTNAHYLHFIEAVTFYHQYQREQKTDEGSGEVYIETTPEDIAVANELIKEILLRKADRLNGTCRDYFEQLKTYLQQAGESSFTNRSAGQAMRIAHSTVKRYHHELQTAGLIKLNEDKKAKSHWYEISTGEEYQALKNSITTVLDTIYRQLQPTGSNRLNSKSEPVKPLTIKRKRATAQ